jgi:hypothetical protein
LPVVSIIGYTNVGKSTLLNALTKSRVYVEDKLFATLDPASRRLRFPREQEVIITDTVGFLRDLPAGSREKCVVATGAYIGIGFVGCFYFHKPLYDFLAIPFTKVAPEGNRLVFTNLTDPFTLYMKVAFISGIFLVSPLVLYEVWKFIAPGLYRSRLKNSGAAMQVQKPRRLFS